MARAWIGYVSMSSGPFTGSAVDCPSPAPRRARNIWNAFCTSPVSRMISDQTDIVTATRFLRGKRSDSDDIGTAPRTNSTPVAPPIAPRTVSDTPIASWMSGASTLNTALSNCSIVPSVAMIAIVRAPPDTNRFTQRHRVAVDARELGVGEQGLGDHGRLGATLPLPR